MRFSILGFNQPKVMETNLDLTDLVILQYIMQANGSPNMKHIVVDDVAYVWLSHAKIHEDLPILGISEGTLRNRLMTLKQEGWIDSITNRTNNGAMTFYSLTMNCMSLINDEPCHAGMTSACHAGMTSNSKLVDSKLNTNTKVLVEEPTPTNIPEESEYESHMYSEDKPKSSKPKKKNLFEKAVDSIMAYTDDKELQDALVEYLKVRLAITDKPIRGIAQWNALLKKLDTLRGNKLNIVLASTSGGWASFFDEKPSGGGFSRNTISKCTNVFGEASDTLHCKKVGKGEGLSGKEY